MLLCIYGANKNQQKPPPVFAKDQIMGVFFKLDEFWKKFSHFSPKCIGQTDRKKRHYHRDGKMSVNDELKNIAQVEHSRHRSLHNFLVNMMSAISASCLFPKKPSIRLEPVSDTDSCRQLCLFLIHRTYTK